MERSAQVEGLSQGDGDWEVLFPILLINDGRHMHERKLLEVWEVTVEKRNTKSEALVVLE